MSLYTPRVRLVVMLALAALVVSACGSSTKAPKVDFATSTAKTTAAGTAHFTLGITATVSGGHITADENGGASFIVRRAHLYKLLPGGGLPREVVVIGAITYTNGNVQAALNDSSVKPWTRLDNRRLSEKQRRAQPDELAHVIAAAYLPEGVAKPVRVGVEKDGTTHFTGRVDPALLARRLPAARRAVISTAVRNDYTRTPFDASFWLDAQGRLVRVTVDYTTAQGSQIAVETTYSEFGAPLDLKLPRADEIQDISPS